MKPVNLAEKLGHITTHWDPHVVADDNENDIMVVKFVVPKGVTHARARGPRLLSC